jgi:CheY-like chemotaxis protein
MDVTMPGLDRISAMREIKQDPHTVDIPVATSPPIRSAQSKAVRSRPEPAS